MKRLYPALALSVTAMLLSSVAHAAEVQKDEGVLPSGFPYQLSKPDNWNGILINDLDAVTNIEGELAKYLLDQGYAYVGTGRHPERMTRHDPLTELDAQVAVINLFTEKYGEAEQTIQYGCSGGGFVALAMAEFHPEAIDGAVSFNARGTGGMAVANTWLDLPFALKGLLAPDSDLAVAPVPNDTLPAAYDAWKPVLEAAQQTPEGRARIALALAVSQWPSWGAIGNPQPKPDFSDLDAAQAAMFKSASDGLGNAINRRQLYDNPEGLASWNTGIDYTAFYEKGADSEQKRIIEELYEAAGLGTEGLTADLAQLNAQPRIEGTSGGVHYWLEPGRLLSGDIKVPLFHAHGLGDALLPPHLLAGYAVAVEKEGHADDYRTAFVEAAGHCVTQPNEAVAAITALSERLETGAWPQTDAATLNATAQALSPETPRYVDYAFETPFNRAFYADSPHPF